MERACKLHGLTEFVLRRNKGYRCKKCATAAVNLCRQRRKEKLIALRGGKCERCGYDKSRRALHFHHLDPKTKSFGIATKGLTRSLEKMLAEVDKCLLVCANCHAELEDEKGD
jgi:DNA-directed RNA polymerase subunit RPC12/RpoP